MHHPIRKKPPQGLKPRTFRSLKSSKFLTGLLPVRIKRLHHCDPLQQARYKLINLFLRVSSMQNNPDLLLATGHCRVRNCGHGVPKWSQELFQELRCAADQREDGANDVVWIVGGDVPLEEGNKVWRNVPQCFLESSFEVSAELLQTVAELPGL